jgi:hypothetical protein
MVTAGGLETSGGWMPSVYYDVDALNCYWRRSVIRLLRASLRAGRLVTLDTSNKATLDELSKLAWEQAKIIGTANGDTIAVKSVTAAK